MTKLTFLGAAETVTESDAAIATETDMTNSLRTGLLGTGVVLATSAATFAAAAVIMMSSFAFAAAKDYRFELVRAVQAGAGKMDVTVRLVRTADGRVVTNAEIFATAAINTVVEPAGSRRFRVETAIAGPQTLQIFAKLPGATRVERTFNSSVKFMQERTIRGPSEVVAGAVSFDAQ